MRELVGRVVLVAGATLVTAGLVECALRVFALPSDAREYVAFRKSSFPGLDYELVPQARVPWAGREIRTNRQGFRGPDLPDGPPSGPRIAVIGDSIAAGYGVSEEEAFPSRLAAGLRGRGEDAEVLNFGVPGYNLARIAALWESRVAAFEPTLVVYALCLNDGRPELRLNAAGVLEAAGAMELAPERGRPGRLPLPGKHWLVEHSYLYRFGMTRYDLLLRRLGVRAEPLPALSEVDLLYEGSPPAVRVRERITALVHSVRSQGAEFVLVCCPLRDQLPLAEPRAQTALRSLSSALGVAFVDLQPAYAIAARETGRALIDADGLHPTALGHEVAARELLALLVPPLRAPAQRTGTGPSRMKSPGQ
jgi:lysophospholipase L1-like esterase